MITPEMIRERHRKQNAKKVNPQLAAINERLAKIQAEADKLAEDFGGV
jgi:hypothetical protein